MFEPGLEIADRFVLTRRLGGGKRAPVWQAQDRGTGMSVALKLQHAPDAGFEAEFEALRAFDHPGLARPRELVRDGELSCLVMDLAAAGDLARLRGGAWRDFLPPLRQVAQALGYLHDRGFVHGDVKAANVLIDASGDARLADFANLKAIGAARDSSDAVSPFSASPQQRAAESAQPGDDIYGFGALLAELLCGQPPGYARGADDGGTAGPLLPVRPAPPGLVGLAQRCLRAQPAERPASMHEVGAALAAELTAARMPEAPATHAPPVLVPPTSAADALRANWQRATSGAAADATQLRRQGFRSGIAIAALVTLGLVALALFIVPAVRTPAPSAVSPAKGAAVPVPAAPANAATTPEPPADLQALAAQKSVADDLRTRASARLAALVATDSGTWAAAGTAAAQSSLASADALMQKRDYGGAQSQLRQLAQQLGALEAQRAPALQAALQRGQQALDQGQSAPAAQAYAEALRINPGNATAVRGAHRAAALDAVVAQLAKARELERQGKTAQAAAAYRQALALDPDAPEAQRGAARTGGELTNDEFGHAMARAYAAISAGRGTEARAAIDEAHRLKPGDPEPARALAQLAATDAAAQLAGALSQAHAAEAAERWQDAVAQYQRALSLDATLVDARRALSVAQERAQLSLELEQLIAHPERSYSDAVYAAGQATLQRARAIATPGPVLVRQVASVSELLAQAAAPVSVTLHSDNLTAVTVYRIGALGNFTERALQLKPGRYVVVGTRTGFRDVRRELNVSPGRAVPTLVIQCVEPI